MCCCVIEAKYIKQGYNISLQSNSQLLITGKYQGCVAPGLIKEEIYVTRGNDLRLQKLWVRYDVRKFGFSNRVVNKWNSLPYWVVSANTTNTFKGDMQRYITKFMKSGF